MGEPLVWPKSSLKKTSRVLADVGWVGFGWVSLWVHPPPGGWGVGESVWATKWIPDRNPRPSHSTLPAPVRRGRGGGPPGQQRAPEVRPARQPL